MLWPNSGSTHMQSTHCGSHVCVYAWPILHFFLDYRLSLRFELGLKKIKFFCGLICLVIIRVANPN